MAERKRLSDILLINSDRDQLERTWSTVKAAEDLKPIPTGEYRCRLLNGELFTSRGGTPGFKLTLEVLGGDYAGRRLWDDNWLTPDAMSRTKRNLAKLGIERFEQLDQPLPDGIIISARVALRKGDDGTESNRVNRFEVVEIVTPEPEPFAPIKEEPAEAASTDADGFDWGSGEQRKRKPAR